MRYSKLLIVGLVLAGLVGSLEVQGQENGRGKPKEAQTKATEPGYKAILAGVDFNDTPLDDVLNYLKDVDKSLQVVVVRDPGVPKGFPIIPQLQLKRVSARQVLRIIGQIYPSIEITPLQDDKGLDVVMVRVYNPAASGDPRDEVMPFTRVFRLAEAVQALVDRPRANKEKTEPKEAMNQILSAVKAVLALNDQAPPVIQVHEDTQILIVKGTAGQVGAVSELISAMVTPAELKAQLEFKHRMAEMQGKLEQEQSKLDSQRAGLMADLESARVQLKDRAKELVEKSAEIERLKVRLEAMQKALQDQKPAEKKE